MNENRAKKKSSKGFTAVMVVVIIAVLALGVVAVKKSYDEKHPYVPTTIADFAKEAGISTEEFMKKWELEGKEGIDGDTAMSEAEKTMTVAKYAEYMGQTYDEYVAGQGFSSKMPADTTVADSTNWIKVEKIAESGGMEYTEFIEFYGLTEEQLPADMPYKEADPIVQEAWGKMPLSKALEKDGLTFEEFLEQEGLTAEEVSPETTLAEVQKLLGDTETAE